MIAPLLILISVDIVPWSLYVYNSSHHLYTFDFVTRHLFGLLAACNVWSSGRVRSFLCRGCIASAKPNFYICIRRSIFFCGINSTWRGIFQISMQLIINSETQYVVEVEQGQTAVNIKQQVAAKVGVCFSLLLKTFYRMITNMYS